MTPIPARQWPILLLPITACGGGGADCVALPCPIPFAISLTISSATAGVAAPAATVEVKEGGAAVTTLTCSSTCLISGRAGTYDVTVSAPGFVSAHRSVQVQGTDPPCGCPTAVTANVTIELSPAT